MDDNNKDKSTVAIPVPGSPGRVSVRGSKETDTASSSAPSESQALSDVRAEMKAAGPETPVNLSPEEQAARVEKIIDYTLPPTPVHGQVQIEVKEPLKQEATVPGSPLILNEVKTELSKDKDPFSPLRAAAIAFFRQFKRQLRIATSASNP